MQKLYRASFSGGTHTISSDSSSARFCWGPNPGLAHFPLTELSASHDSGTGDGSRVEGWSGSERKAACGSCLVRMQEVLLGRVFRCAICKLYGVGSEPGRCHRKHMREKKAEAWTDQTKATAKKVIILGRTFNVLPRLIQSLSATANLTEVTWWGPRGHNSTPQCLPSICRPGAQSPAQQMNELTIINKWKLAKGREASLHILICPWTEEKQCVSDT